MEKQRREESSEGWGAPGDGGGAVALKRYLKAKEMGFVKDAIPPGSPPESQGCDSATLVFQQHRLCSGGDNYTARAFRALTYLSPGRERDETTSAYLLVLISECGNLSFLVCFQQCFVPFSYFFVFSPSRGWLWKFGARSLCSFDDFQEKKRKRCKGASLISIWEMVTNERR